MAAGARFVITQLGYDAGRFKELLNAQHGLGLELPTLGSVYVLTPASARIMNAGQVPGAEVTDELLHQVVREWQDKRQGRALAIERAARLGAVLKGMGYRGIHIAGVHRGFDIVGRILDRLAQIEDQWRCFLDDFAPGKGKGGCPAGKEKQLRSSAVPPRAHLSLPDRIHFRFLKVGPPSVFQLRRAMAPLLRWWLDGSDSGPPAGFWHNCLRTRQKRSCSTARRCGDCAIQHVAFLCPESQCPKHIRNGACGGSRNGCCEVYPERKCVWFRAWERWAEVGQSEEMAADCIPPRLWELDGTSSWLNFHLRRDHQSGSGEILQACRAAECRIPPTVPF